MRLFLLVISAASVCSALSRVRRQGGVLPSCVDPWTQIPNPCKSNPSNIIYFPHPRDPTKFLQCDQLGQMYIIQCPENTSYNSATRSCKAPITTTAPVHVGKDNPCTAQNIANGKQYFAIPNDETHFIECGPGGDANIMPCPNLLVWDQSKLSCVYKASLLSSQAKPTSSDGLLPPSVKNPCDSKHITPGHSLFFSHPDPTKFVQCGIAGDAYVMACPSGLVWNEYNSQCISPYASSLVTQGN